MSYLIDSHCHIHDQSVYNFALSRQKKQTSADFSPEKIFERMAKNDVKKAICVGTTHEDSLVARDFAGQHDDVFWSYGIHPEEANCDDFYVSEEQLKEPFVDSTESNGVDVINPATAGRPVAIGEVGLDYHSEGYNRDAQIRLLEQMLDLATRNNLPLIFHVRDAFDDFFAALDNFHGLRGVVHSFSDTQKNLQKSLARGFYIGVNGLATFANLPLPPLEKTLLETDSPFLAPVPFRGKVNDPSHIKDIALWLADKHQISFDEIANTTVQNAKNLFNI